MNNQMPNNDRYKHRSLDGFNNRPSQPKNQTRFPAVGVSLPAYTQQVNSQAGRQRSPQTGFRTNTGYSGQTSKSRSKKTGWLSKLTKKRVLIAIVVILMAIGLFLGGKFIYNAARIFRGNIFSALTTTKLKGEDRGRVNILLAGNSADDPGHQGASLTDSIMILSIDTRNNVAFMLSIPRDLWVEIPGYGHHKINEAYNDGEQDEFRESGYPDGGMGMLEKVIEENFNINLHYYSLVNYNAFRQSVDAVGGITVDIKSSDKRGLYDPNISKADGGPLKLRNGVQELDGREALNLARARGDHVRAYGFPASDFDRTNNQRMMLLALKSKMTSSGVVTNPVKLNNLMDALGSNVKTDLELGEVRRLVDLSKKVGNSNIKSLSLNDANGKNLLASYTSFAGESALIPAAGLDDFSDIQRYMKKILSTNPIVKESASVVVLNGTDTFGLAGKNSEILQNKGINVTDTGDSLRAASTTTIINNVSDKKPATLKLLKDFYSAQVTTTNPYKDKYKADFIIILGDDRLDLTD
jgi:LCP family protein required for cell wall assembly